MISRKVILIILFSFYYFIIFFNCPVRRLPSAVRDPRPPSAVRRPPSASSLYRVPFLSPLFCKSICPWHGFAGPEALSPFHLLLGSTLGYLPALAYASDRHVTDVISDYVPSVPCYVCSVSVIYSIQICYIQTFMGISPGL